MDISAFVENDDELVKFQWKLCLSPTCWIDNSAVTLRFHNESDWSDYIKYLNDNNEDLSDEIKNLPNDCGGIYVFFVQGINLPFSERYLAYVGRARYTESENLRNRLKRYLPESLKNDNKRPKIKKLFRHWKEYLYIRYYKSSDNEFIDEGESALIKAILPPFNSQLTEYKIKEPQKAF